MIHRDIKPENVILQPIGGLKLLDIGVVRLPNIQDFPATAVPGTPSYMAPEMIEGQPGDERSDIFALGGDAVPDGQRRLSIWRSGGVLPSPLQPPARIDRRLAARSTGMAGSGAAAGDQSNAMNNASATSAGFSLPSISTVLSNVIRTPPFTSSTAFSTWVSLTRDPAGTMEVNRTLFVP